MERLQDIPVIPVYYEKSMKVVERWQDIAVIPVYYEKVMKVVERWQDISCNTCVL